jgi:acyl carrier protein
MMASGEQPDPFTVVAAALRCSGDSLSIESAMYRDHGWDSFGHVRVITAIEETYGINIPNDEIMRYTTMRAIVAFFEHCWGTGRRGG